MPSRRPPLRTLILHGLLGLLLALPLSAAAAGGGQSLPGGNPSTAPDCLPTDGGDPGAAPCGPAAPASQADPDGIAHGAGNPIDVLTGNKYQRDTDLPALPGVLAIEIVRHYNSAQAGTGAPLGLLGRGWRLSYETDLHVLGSRLHVVQADGTGLVFDRDPADARRHLGTDPRRGVLERLPGPQARHRWHWPDGRTLDFDARGKLVQIALPSGEFLSLTRGPRGELMKVTDPQGRSLSFEYAPRDTSGFRGIVAITSPLGRFRYAHQSDPARPGLSNLAAVSHPDGGVRHYHYGADANETAPAWPHHLTGISLAEAPGEDRPGAETPVRRLSTYAYDAAGRAILSVRGTPRQHDESGKVSPGTGVEQVELDFSTPGTTVLTNGLGERTTYRHTRIGGEPRLLEALGAGCARCGETDLRYAYDTRGRLIQLTRLDPAGQPRATTLIERDAAGRVVRESVRPYVGGQALREHTRVRYAYAGDSPRPVLVARPSGVPGQEHQLHLRYNAAGQLLQATETGFSPLDAAGEPASGAAQATPIERTTTYAYTRINGRSLLTEIDGPLPNGPEASPEDSDVARFQWDEQGRFITAVDAPGGFRIEDERDPAGRTRTRRFDDGNRRIDTTWQHAGQPSIALQPERIERSAWMLADGLPQPTSRIDHLLLQARFDALGRRTQREDASGNVQTLQYDAAGRPASLRNSAGEQRHWAYDAASRPLAWISQDAQGKVSDGRLWLRDEGGRLRATLTPGGIERIHAYLDEGRAGLPTQARAQARPVSAPARPSPRPTVLHDDFGREVWQSHPEDGELTTRYIDEPGGQRQTQIQRAHAPDAAPLEETLRFDHAGRLVERRRNGCTETLRYEGALLMHLQGCTGAHRYERDALGRITAHQQQHFDHGDPVLTFTQHYRYDAAGRLHTRTLADGQTLTYGYDRASRTESVQMQRAWRRFLARLIGEDTAHALTRWMPAGWCDRSIVEAVRHRPFDAGPTALLALTHGNGEQQHWAPPDPARGLAIPVGAPMPAPASTPDALPGHDAWGRLTRHTPASGPHRGQPQRLVWDDAHQLVEVRRARDDTLLARYTYDSLGNRTAKTLFDARGQAHTTRYLYDTAHRLVAQADHAGRIERHYLYADHRPHSLLTDTGDVLAVHGDWRGLPARLGDARRHTVWAQTFDARGFAPTDEAHTPMPLRLAGQHWDAETGLHYNIHRYYDPASGRYISPDPLGTPDGTDRYAYLNGNPQAGIDPLGLFAIPTQAFGGYPYLPTTDGGHGDIVRIAFAQYNLEHGLRFSQAIIDQILLNNYHTDSQALPLLNPGGGQGNPSNHFDNPNNGPLYDPDGQRLPEYSDGEGNQYIADALNQIKANRMYYQNATHASGGGLDISRILSHFGQNTHTLADFYAHTNWVDGSPRGGAVCNDLGTARAAGLPARADRLYVPLTSNPSYVKVYEVGYVPAGLGMITVWDETLSEALFSGTVSLTPEPLDCTRAPLGDVQCSTDKTTHGYWAKDDEHHAGGAEFYNGPDIYRWVVKEYDGEPPWKEILVDGELRRVDLDFGTEWYADYGIIQSEIQIDDRIYVREKIINMHQLAFYLAVEHTKQEIARLYDANAGHSIGGISLHGIFKMDAEALAQSNVTYDTRHPKN